MNMDSDSDSVRDDNDAIDDILFSLQPDTTPPETRDLQELTRCWVAERTAPELLPWPEDIVERVLERIRAQIELVEEQTGSLEPKTNFRLIVIQTEVERFKFLVRSFLRARLRKIDTHPLHILSLHNLSLGQSSLMSTPLLSPSEHQYLTTHQALLAAHYHSSFLSQFPALLQRLDDTTGGTNMIDTPDVDAAVFVRALKDAGVMEIEGTGTTCDIKRGDVWVVRWSAISAWVKAGDLEVI